MPATHPRPSDQPRPKASAESKRTAIIAGVFIGTLAILVLVGLLWRRRINQGAKAGTRIRMQMQSTELQRQRVDKDIEMGVIHEPLPVYQKELIEVERSLVMAKHLDR